MPITVESVSTSPELSFSVFAKDLSIAQGTTQSVSIDMSGTNVKSFRLNILIYQSDDPEAVSDISVELKSPPEELRCIGQVGSSLTCINNGPIESFNFENLEIEFSVPPSENVGMWDVSFMAAVWDTEIPNENSENATSTLTDTLTVTTATTGHIALSNNRYR